MNELIDRFEEWNHFVNQIKEANWDLALGEGKWTIHDVVSHIMFWDLYFFKEAVQRIVNGQTLTLKHIDFDLFNKDAMKKGKNLSKEELVSRTIAIRDQLLEYIRSMNEEQWTAQYVDADGNPFEVRQYLKDFIWHDEHHMNQLKGVLGIA